MAIGLIAETGGDNRFFLCCLPPFLHSFGCGFGQKPCLAKHQFNRAFDLDPQTVDHMPHPLYPVRAPGDFFQRIADWLLARNIRRGTEQGCEKSRWFAWAVARPPSAKAETGAAGFGIDIDKPPVHLAPCRAVAERADSLIERRVGENRSVDEHRVLRDANRKLLRQYPL